MGLKVCFYISIKDEKEEEIDLLKQYEDTEKGHCIYSIKAGEICSEFMARYFKRTKTLPKLLLNELLKENYNQDDIDSSIKDIYNGIYIANIEKMVKDNIDDFEFQIFKECKNVRKKLLNKYQEIYKKIKETINEPKIDIYAFFVI